MTTPSSARGRTALLVLATMGAVSLVFQVTWTRQLTTLLGSNVAAVALITAMFMVGMALGAWAVGRRADRNIGTERLLGVLAVGLGVTGAAAVPLHLAVLRAYQSGTFGDSTLTPMLLATLLAAMMTLLPTAFVGAGFPVAGRILVLNRRNISGGVSAGYVAGTLGSILGALVGGFALIPVLGVNLSILAASAVSVAVGVGVITLASGPVDTVPDASAADEDAAGGSHPTRRPALIAFTLSGATVMIYETIWTRELLLVFGASVYGVATMLAAALTGLAIGQWVGGSNQQDRSDALGTIGLLQLAGAGMAMLSLLLTRAVPLAYYVARGSLPGGIAGFVTVQFVLSFLVVALPCALLGATAPIAVRLGTSRRSFLGRDIGDAYALNTAGAVVGSLVGGLVLMPALSTAGTAAVAAALNVGAAVVALKGVSSSRLTSGAQAPIQGRLIAAVTVVLLGFTSLLTISSASTVLSIATTPANKNVPPAHFFASTKMISVVYAKDAPQGRVSVFQDPQGTLSLHVSGMNEGASVFNDVQTTETMVCLPSAIRPDIEKVLVVGLGTGFTSRTALELPSKPRVDTVEINPAVIEASRFFLEDEVESNPRATLVVDDARHYYATSAKTYDLIASEPSYPLSTYSARMFTRESFKAASNRLNADGMMVEWLPAYMMEQRDLDMMTKTFASVFPTTYVWATMDPNRPDTPLDYMMVGFKTKTDVDPAAVETAMRQAGGGHFAVRYLRGPSEVQELLVDDSVPVNTDDHPLFEYRIPLGYLRSIWQ